MNMQHPFSWKMKNFPKQMKNENKIKIKKTENFCPKKPNGVNFPVENFWVANEKWEAPRQETTFIKNIPFSGISGLYHAIFLVPFLELQPQGDGVEQKLEGNYLYM